MNAARWISRSLSSAFVLCFALVLANVPSAQAEEPHSAPRPEAGSPSSMEVSPWAGPALRFVSVSGKLVCLRCDLKPGPGSAALCRKEGHRHALDMTEGLGAPMIHPLLAPSEAMQERINSEELHHKQVVVEGKYYPATGAILVSKIEEKK